MSEILKLYHTGYQHIPQPDVRHGRKNADFGQGFYTSADCEFSKRWARVRRGEETILNSYELSLEGLKVHRFIRDESWFRYIYENRNHMPDSLAEYDVIIGPIANDTLYDTFGIITSGFLTEEQSLELLLLGGEYEQIVIKSEKAAGQLTFTGSSVLAPDEIVRYREAVAREEKEFQKAFGELLETF